MRIILAHIYWRTDYDLVWGVITDDIPGILETAEREYEPPASGPAALDEDLAIPRWQPRDAAAAVPPDLPALSLSARKPVAKRDRILAAARRRGQPELPARRRSARRRRIGVGVRAQGQALPKALRPPGGPRRPAPVPVAAPRCGGGPLPLAANGFDRSHPAQPTPCGPCEAVGAGVAASGARLAPDQRATRRGTGTARPVQPRAGRPLRAGSSGWRRRRPALRGARSGRCCAAASPACSGWRLWPPGLGCFVV